MLKLHPEETEFMLIGSIHPPNLLKHPVFFCMDLLSASLEPSYYSAKNLGVIFDSSFTFSDHLSSKT